MGDGDDNKSHEIQQLWARSQNTEAGQIMSSRKLEMKLEIRRKLISIRKALKADLTAADMKWSLFVAACNSHSYDDMAEPFPTEYVTRGGVKDIETLIKTIEDTPPFSLLLMQKNDRYVYAIKNSVVNLLHWLLVETSEPYLKTVEPERIDTVLSNVSCEMTIPKPNRIFQVIHSANSEEEKNWTTIAKRTESLYTCYGSKLEKFYSILHHGMKHFQIKTTPKGRQGVYLSSDLCDGIGRSPSGYGWGGSACGSQLCCVALCELADHESFICCHQFPSAEHPIVQEVEERPVKHYNVTSPELIRVRYLLIYNDKQYSSEEYNDKSATGKGCVNWVKNHKLMSLFLGYGMLLVGTWITDIFLL